MKGDFSRLRFDRARNYTSVLAQQGRVQLDSDANEQRAIDEYLRAIGLADIIGRSRRAGARRRLRDHRAGRPHDRDRARALLRRRSALRGGAGRRLHAAALADSPPAGRGYAAVRAAPQSVRHGAGLARSLAPAGHADRRSGHQGRGAGRGRYHRSAANRLARGGRGGAGRRAATDLLRVHARPPSRCPARPHDGRRPGRLRAGRVPARAARRLPGPRRISFTGWRCITAARSARRPSNGPETMAPW